MFRKLTLKRKIKKCKKSILVLERKRERSQAALVQAILTNTTPQDNDVDFFNEYSSKIDDIRRSMNEYQKQLDR